MFLVQSVPVQGNNSIQEALVFYDKGSNVSMIRNETAQKLGLEGLAVQQKLVRSGADVMDWNTKAYKVPLISKVDLLIGINFLEVQPREVAREKGLSLWESSFGTGYLLGGTHPDIWLGGRKEALVSEALQVD